MSLPVKVVVRDMRYVELVDYQALYDVAANYKDALEEAIYRLGLTDGGQYKVCDILAKYNLLEEAP